jgi:AraC-like DNA-binding protein
MYVISTINDLKAHQIFVNIGADTVINNFKKYTNSTRDTQSIKLKLVTSYSIFLFIILVLFLYLFNTGSQNSQNQYKWQVKSTLTSNVELFEKDIDIMNVYCRQFLQNEAFRRITALDETSDRFSDIGNQLAMNMATDVYPESLLPISDIYCYLPTSDYILAPNYFIKSSRFYNWIKRYSDNYEDIWMKALTSCENYYHFISMNDFMEGNVKNYYMYMINLNDLNYMNINAIACFIFKEEDLAAFFDIMDSDNEYRFISVKSSDNESILTLPADSSANFEGMILDGTMDSAENYLKSVGMAIDVYTSADSGYSYYYSYPAYEAAANFARPQILYVVMFIAIIVGGVGLIYILSKGNMKPVVELDMQLKTSEQEKSDLLEERSHLQEVMDTQRPIIFNSYVRQLLKGNIVSDEEAAYAKEYLGLTNENFVYNSLYIVAYNNVNDEDTPPSIHRSTEECNQIVMEMITKHMGERPYCFSPSDRAYALIVVGKANEADKLIIQTNELIVKMHDELLDTYGIWLFAGIGKNTDELVNVWESYQQAKEAVNYTSKNYIFFPYEFIKKDSSAFYYPPELSTKLIHFITAGNTPQVMELFNLLHQENIEERSLPINMLQFLLSDIRNTLLKARFALPADTPKDKLEALDECFNNQHVTFKLCEDIALRLCRLFTVETDDSNMISAIERYIKENYTDPSMGLNKISDEFQISESYFSHMFKEKTGVNFSTYLENIRMHEAARLIKETDTSLNELYILVGYNNANSFRRAFKKVYGVTPSAMRG